MRRRREHSLDGSPGPGAPRRLDRRRFLALAAGGAGGALVLSRPLTPVAQHLLGGTGEIPLRAAVAGDSVLIARADDQLLVTVELLNLAPGPSGALEPVDPSEPAALRYLFGSQHAAEEPVAEGDPAPELSQTVARRHAGPSRVVVLVEGPVPFTVAGLLDPSGRELAVDQRTVAGGTGAGAPADAVTAVEVPADVVLSPGPEGRFMVEPAPAGANGVQEVWQLRLGRDAGGEPREASGDDPVAVRAVHGGVQDDDVVVPLDQTMRAELVAATTGWTDPRYPDTEPVLARRLRLSLHGADADLWGAWAGSGPLAFWAERIRSGSTVQATVVERGFLAPFGQPAAVVATTERRFEAAPDGTTAAVLVAEESLLVGDPAIHFPRPHMADEGRHLPFRDLEVAAPSVPIGRRPVSWTDPSGVLREIDPEALFQLSDALSDDELHLAYTAIDRAGNPVHFEAATFFVVGEAAFDEVSGASVLDDLADYYNGSLQGFLRSQLHLEGQPVAFADELEAGSGATTKATEVLNLRLDRPGAGVTGQQLQEAGQPAFWPAMATARVSDEALRALSGSTRATVVSLDPTWLEHGSGEQNVAGAFLRLSERIELDLTAGEGAGLVAPSFNIDVFTQQIGFTTDATLASGQWNPLDALGEARLLGVVPLLELIPSIPLGGAGADGLPVLDVHVERPSPLAPPTAVCQEFLWKPELRSFTVAGTRVLVVTADLAAAGLADPFGEPSSLTVRAEACASVEAGPQPDLQTAMDLEVALEHVVVQLPPGAPAIAVQFRRVAYLDPPDAPSSVDFDLAGVEFVGPLAFLDLLRSLLSSTGAEATVDLDPSRGFHITARSAPGSVNLGVLGLSNLWVGVELFLPIPQINQDPAEDPFTTWLKIGTKPDPVTAKLLNATGTASFVVRLEPPPMGLARLTAAVNVSVPILAIGVGVSGSIGLVVGASIDIDKAADEVTVGGLVGVYGEIKVFEVASVGVSATLELKYLINAQILRAKGTVTGWVTVAWVDKEWRLEVSSDFPVGGGTSSSSSMALEGRASLDAPAGAGASGSFRDVHTQETWSEYCEAFA